MNDYIKVGIWGVAIGVVFAVLWKKGVLLRARNYWGDTMEELKKCTWPTWGELKGSTLVVLISIVLLGAFTVGIDLVIGTLVKWLIT